MARLARYVIVGIQSYGMNSDSEFINFVVRDTLASTRTYYVVEGDMSEGDEYHNGCWRTYLRESDPDCIDSIDYVPYDLQYIDDDYDQPDFYSAVDHGDDYYPSYRVSIEEYAFRDIDSLMEEIETHYANNDTKRITELIENVQPEIFNIVRKRNENIFKLLPAEVQLTVLI